MLPTSFHANEDDGGSIAIVALSSSYHSAGWTGDLRYQRIDEMRFVLQRAKPYNAGK